MSNEKVCGKGQTRRTQIKNDGAEKINFCLPYVWCIKFIVNTFGYLKTDKKIFMIISN